jgi:hypothetical protein
MLPIKYLMKTAAAFAIAIALSGCVVYPAPYYHHPHWGYY